jgi:hypothetical protein
MLNRKFAFLLLLLTHSFSFLNAQSYAKKKLLYDEIYYIWELQYSLSGNYILYNCGSLKSAILDKDYKKVKEFIGNPFFGMGFLQLNYSDEYAVYETVGDMDTIHYFNLKTGTSKFETYGIIDDIKIYHHSNKVVINQSGYLTIKNLDSLEKSKTIFLPNPSNNFRASITISADDKSIFVSAPDSTIQVYSTVDYKKQKTYGPFKGWIDNLSVAGDQLFFSTNDNHVHAFSMEKNEDISVKFETDYIGEVYFDRSYNQVIYTGNGENTYAMHLDSDSKQLLINEKGSKYHYALLRVNENELLSNDDGKLILYEKNSLVPDEIIGGIFLRDSPSKKSETKIRNKKHAKTIYVFIH